jgi:hypothetical protein
MSILNNVAEYIRKHSIESSRAYHISEVAAALGITVNQAQTARSHATRKFDDIFPCAPGMMAYEPGWKENHPEVWEQAQERSRKAKTGIARAAKADKRIAERRKSERPNVIGPVIMIQNVVGVNIHPDHVAIQHEDGTWTELTGTVTLNDRKQGRQESW